MEKLRAVTASHPIWLWPALALASLPLFMALNIEGIYASALFGLRIYAVFCLKPARYPLAAAAELMLALANPFDRLFAYAGPLDSQAMAIHAAGVATTYLCAWLLRNEIARVGADAGFSPYRLATVLVALAAATVAAVMSVEHLLHDHELSFLLSAAFARLSAYLITALLFGVYAVFARSRPAVIPRRAAATVAAMLVVCAALVSAYRLFDLSGNLSVVFLFLTLLLVASVYLSFRYGRMPAIAASYACIVLFSSAHEGWSLNTWHANAVYLLLFTGSCIFAAMYTERIRATERRLVESAQREGSLIRNLQQLELSLEARNADHVNAIIRSLHDDVGQGLVAANLYMRVLQGRATDPGVLEAAAKASEMLEYAERRMRGVLNQLAEDHLDFGAIHAELAVGRIAVLLKASGIDYRLTVSSKALVWQELDARYWRFIYRFFQESVTNVLRHSSAGRCRIQLLAHQDDGGCRVLISIRDSDTANYYDFRRSDSMGLKNLMSAGAALGGRFHHCLRPEFKKMAFCFRFPAR